MEKSIFFFPLNSRNHQKDSIYREKNPKAMTSVLLCIS